MIVSRRTALLLAGLAPPRLSRAAPAGSSTTGSSTTGSSTTGSSTAPSLAQLAAAAGLRFGSASDVAFEAAPAAYAEAFAAQCRLLAPNMGWHRVAPLPGATRPVWEDPNVAFARQHAMPLTGAHLLWHKALPQAFRAAEPGPAARALAAGHIAMMGRHYAGQAFSWNVVNEAIDTEAGDGDGLRRSLLLAKLGPGFIADAFHAARAADPHALLAYNETHLELDTPLHEARRTALLRLLDRLAKDGAPVGAVGLQTHLRLDGSRFELGTYRRFLRAIADRGLRILITELDVFDIGVAGSLAERDTAVAGLYRDVLSVIVAEPAVASVVTWGLSDRYTWLTPQTDPAYRRRDGAPARPLPLDDAFQPKRAFAAIADAFRNACPRRPA